MTPPVYRLSFCMRHVLEIPGLVGCSLYAVVSIFQKWPKKRQPVTQQEAGHRSPRQTDALSACLTVAQTAERLSHSHSWADRFNDMLTGVHMRMS